MPSSALLLRVALLFSFLPAATFGLFYGFDLANLNPIEIDAFNAALNVNNRINNLLDSLSSANGTAEEDAILGQIRPLLHPDVVVVTNGQTFSEREFVLQGMRFVHSISQDRARRLLSSPVLIDADFSGSQKSVTIYQIQDHHYTNPSTGEQGQVIRDTFITLVKEGFTIYSSNPWQVIYNQLDDVIGSLDV